MTLTLKPMKFKILTKFKDLITPLSDDEFLCPLALRGTSRLLWRVVVRPLHLFHAPIPSENSLGLHDAGDFSQPVPYPHAAPDQYPPLPVGQGHPLAKFAPEDLVFPPEVVVLQSKIPAEELLYLGNERLA